VQQRTKDMGAASNGEAYDYQHERARLTHLQAEKIELENNIAKGDLIPADVVTATWTEAVMNMRARILAMPSRIAHSVFAAKDYAEAHEIVKAACYEALNEISTDDLTDEQLARIDDASKSLQSGCEVGSVN
jgi:phage terminase Nu1 subunit (DNA packaging protein)